MNALFASLFDPLLCGPLFGSLLVAAALSIFGVFAFVRREGLVGEMLAHSTYPGIILAAFLTGILGGEEGFFSVALIACALIFGWLALKAAGALKRFGVSADSRLCFVLVAFFSLGMLGSSICQHLFPFWQRQSGAYLFGQVALMDERHLVIGLFLLGVAILYCRLFFKEAMAAAFDPAFSKSARLRTSFAERTYQAGLVLAIVFAIKSVGVVLLSGLLIAPAVAARGCTCRLLHMLFLAPAFALLGTLGGLSLSLFVPAFQAIPPGPLIVLILSLLCLGVHLVAPKSGLLARLVRRFIFRLSCLEENILKVLWRSQESGDALQCTDRESLYSLHLGSKGLISWSLAALRRQGDLAVEGRCIALTEKGLARAAHIVRLHRLWEAYLASQLDVSAARVHASAEQIEHILTPELEKQLEMLVDSDTDPHKSLIPAKDLVEERA